MLRELGNGNVFEGDAKLTTIRMSKLIGETNAINGPVTLGMGRDVLELSTGGGDARHGLDQRRWTFKWSEELFTGTTRLTPAR